MSNLYECFFGACERGDLQAIKQAIRKVNVNEKNENGYSGLALAVRNGNLEIVCELLKENADVNSINEVNSI